MLNKNIYVRAALPYTQITDLSLLSSVQQKVHVLLVTDDAINTHKLGPQLQSLFMKSEVKYDKNTFVLSKLLHNWKCPSIET